jgi:methylenetetrahydrofolate reductase (NADPH)
MVSRLVASGLVQGVHFCTLNLEKSVRTILENIGWTQGTSPAKKFNELIGDEKQDRTTSPGDASQLAEWGLHQSQSPVPKRTAVGGGQSAEDSWDEYPNGRFTDVRSPAYGEIDGWGSGLKTTVSFDCSAKANGSHIEL